MSSSESRVNNGKISKVDRYGWSDPGEPGRFQMIHKDQIVIPEESYQRSPSSPADNKVLRIAANFSWVAFQVVAVVERGGCFYALDAGHRVRAARRRDDITMLPCMVYNIASIEEEAKAFDVTNSNRKAMSAFDRHRAHIVQGDAIALKAESYAKAAGRHFSKNASSGTISCVNDIKRCIREDEEALSRIWPIVIELCEGEKLVHSILMGLFYIEKMASEGVSSPRVSSKVLRLGYDAIARAAKEGAAYHGMSTGKAFADGIVKAVNKGFQNKVEFSK